MYQLTQGQVTSEWLQRARTRDQLRAIELANGRDRYFLLVTGSLGDVLPTLCLIRLFREVSRTRVCVLVDQKYALFVRRFENPSLEFKFIDQITKEFLHDAVSTYRQPFLLDLGRLYPTLITLHPLLPEAVRTLRITDFEAKRLILQLPPAAPIFFPMDDNSRRAVSEIFKQNELKIFNTVLISPLGVTNPTVPHLVVCSVVEHLAGSPFTVVINLAGIDEREASRYDEGMLHKIPKIRLTPEICLEFLESSGYYFGGPSGLTSIAMICGLPMKVVQYRSLEMSNSSPDGTNLLVSMELALRGEISKNASVLEIVHYNENTTEEEVSAQAVQFFVSEVPLGVSRREL